MNGGLRELALFAGAGGGILGGKLLGWSTVCAVEFNPYARRVLLARQRDGHLEPFPIWDDIRTFDGHPWRGAIDVISGGFPCQDISSAGKGAGIKGSRSGLWVQMARIVREVSPRFVFVENSPILTSRGLGVVLGDLAAMGYDARWGVLGARHAGAPHKRDRIWILACHAHGKSKSTQPLDEEASWLPSVATHADCAGQQEQRRAVATQAKDEPAQRSRAAVADAALPNDETRSNSARIKKRSQWKPGGSCSGSRSQHGWWEVEPPLGRVVDGVAHRVDRLRALGNGQVPAVAALAWLTLGGPA